MTRDTGLSITEAEDDDSLHCICAKLIGRISGDVYRSWSVTITSQKVKLRFLDFVEVKLYEAKHDYPIWEPYDLVIKG